MANNDFKFTDKTDLNKIGFFFETIIVSPIGEPAFIPKSRVYDQIKIVTDSLSAPTARRLYMYSFGLQDWLYITLST